MRYAKGVLITLGAKGLAIPIGIASSILTARYLGPSGRGVLAVLLALQAMAVQFGSVGFNASITYFISRDKDRTSSVASNALVVALVLGLVCVAVFLGAGIVAPELILGKTEITYLFIFLAAIPFSFFPQFFQNVFIAHQKVYEFNLLDLFARALLLAAFILILPLLHLGTREAVWCLVVISIVTGVVYLQQTAKVASIAFRFDQRLFRDMFRYGVKSYIAGLFLFFITRSNIFLITYLLGKSESGVYSVALQFMDVVYILPTALGLILFPKVSENANDPGELTAKVFRFSILVMGLICGGIAIVAYPLIRLMFGEQFLGAVQPLVWLAPGIFALSLSNIIFNDLAGRGLPNIIMIAPAVGCVANFIIVPTMLQQWGITAAAVGSTTAYLIMLLLSFAYFVRDRNIPIHKMLWLTVADIRSIQLKESR